MYAALASQKSHMAVYLTGIYADDGSQQEFEARYRATGKRYDLGKSCVRFRKLEDLPLSFMRGHRRSRSQQARSRRLELACE